MSRNSSFGSGTFFNAYVFILSSLSLRLLGRHSGPFMHALHFFYGIGAFLSPLIVKPFLDNTPCRAAQSSPTASPVTATNTSFTGAEAMALVDARPPELIANSTQEEGMVVIEQVSETLTL